MIEWKDGKLVSQAIVNEDGTITPAVYEGNTPLSSYNLNKMQSDILEDGIIVSPTEPTADRRKVWFQKGEDTNTIYVKNDNGEYEEFVKKEDKRRVLYDGGATTENITLNDSIENYDYVEIFYRFGNATYTGSKKIDNFSGNIVLDIMFGTIEGSIQCASSVITLNNNTITRQRTRGVTISSSGSTSAVTSPISIIKVVGCKD